MVQVFIALQSTSTVSFFKKKFSSAKPIKGSGLRLLKIMILIDTGILFCDRVVQRSDGEQEDMDRIHHYGWINEGM